MVIKLNKCERIRKFEKLEGWYFQKGTNEYAPPDNSTKSYDAFNVFKLKFIDPAGNYALYKSLQLNSQTVFDNLSGAGATSSTASIQGVVASYDRNTGQIKLEIVDMDDKSIGTCTGNGKKFIGTQVEFGLNTAAKNDGALFGGYVGGFTLKKLEMAPTGFENFSFDHVYKSRHDAVYLDDDN
jgi:hypothetical protein